jgi:ATP-dependent RNA helicase DeaD
VPARALGAIEIAENFSLVSVPEELADDIVAVMKKASLRGQPITIRRDRDA